MAHLCEKLGHHAECLPYLEVVFRKNWTDGGTDNLVSHSIAHTIQGRAYAAVGKMDEAANAFEAAAEEARTSGALIAPPWLFKGTAHMHQISFAAAR